MIYRFGLCELDTERVELRHDGQLQAVEPQVFRLLVYLLEQRDKVLGKDDIMAHIWRDRVVTESSLSSCIKAVRQAIGDKGETQTLIRTVRGVGFRFIGEVQQGGVVDTPIQPSVLPVQNSPVKLLGRERQLSEIHTLLARCQQSGPGHLLVRGAAGIGKSRFMDAISAHARQQAWCVAWGRCREDAGLPAFWPWRQLLRELYNRFNTQVSFADVLACAPELLGLPGNGSDAAGLSLQSSRFRLFSAISQVLTACATHQPLLLMFDDLHRADSPSLELLEFLADQISHAPICLAGAYRDTDLTDTHRFLQTIDEFSRQPHALSLRLDVLEPEACRAIISDNLKQPLEGLVEALIRRSEGHPLYLSELLAHIRQGGAQQELPNNLKAMISRRIVAMPTETRELLRRAAVIGRDFSLPLLVAFTGQTPTDILAMIEPALAGGQLQSLDSPGHYQFTHVLIRETFYDSLPGTVRLHLHYNLADALEALGGELERIAYHYHLAAPLGGAEKATAYSLQAAREADRLMAYEVSIRLYKQGLQTATQPQLPDITLGLGLAQLRAGESLQAVSTFADCVASAIRFAQEQVMVNAAIGLEEALWRPGLPGDKAVAVLYRVLSELPDDQRELRLRIKCALVRALMMCGQGEESVRLHQKLRTAINRDDSLELQTRILLCGLIASQLHSNSANEVAYWVEQGQQAYEMARQTGQVGLTMDVQSWLSHYLLRAGQIPELENLLKAQSSLLLRNRQPFFQYFQTLFQAGLACCRGQFSKSHQLAEQAVGLARWLPGQDVEGVYGVQVFTLKRELGQLRQLAPLVEHFVRMTQDNNRWQPGLALIYCELGQTDKARPLLDHIMAGFSQVIPKDGMWATSLVYLSEVCFVLQAKQHASTLYSYLSPLAGTNIAVGINIGCLGAADYYLGLLSAAMGEETKAIAHLQNAQVLNGKQGFLTWAIHGQLALATLLLKSADPTMQRKVLGSVKEVYDQAVVAGMERAKAMALSLLEQHPQKVTQTMSEEALSKREIDVLRQVAAGKNNREISQSLFISEHTVAAHMRNILDKSRTTNRTEAVAWANQKGLLED
ncbi:AAA family ATPase [Bowmanella sp. Y26]|uniref:helix-turn-helix transcriptional regulator n=1 Tax=Bowmanella yangjiangensis TaxID=2811230 RepID=UPI001BDC1536|nr:AAA family ATPase [Bowmanella yangjiangensis]MBT1064016.1 AAA family ATPase [Bowmanella yangjiangensis]